MRRLCLILGLILLPGALSAQDLRPGIKREASRCAAAWQREDYNTMVAYLPSRVIQQSGGRGAMVRELKAQFAQARDYGAESLEIIPGPPSSPKPIGKWLTSILPLTAVLHGPHLDLIQETHVLALSIDAGKHWSFLLLHQTTQEQLNAWFPEFTGRLFMPKDPEPRLEAVF
jgi:hypothetical protein